ncbi:DinB family protein [Saccharibacillus sp. CPCC 101409]|uniref:DinB family protein n=1 Tax=Saccharibacillus sp. CPCC 101409 TaxID=3058041 RepID=UPI002671E2B3|nr:DinB family protein [Saccharibacillus sp. CPCC 101409]MDO3410853.1 DinB family protein [Saccharibacillus sp. CPCC 101409]
MQKLFEYNWLVRGEWFDWCGQVPEEELTRERTGGFGSILKTLVHVVDIEHAWIRGLMGEPESHYPFEPYATLEAARKLSDEAAAEIRPFVLDWTDELDDKRMDIFTYGDIMRHLIAHEIHHIGQLSIWSRELGLKPVSANLILRGPR